MTRLVLIAVIALMPIEALAVVRGAVMNAAGNPLPSASVQLLALEDDAALLRRLTSEKPVAVPVAEATTDARGNFSIEEPEAGAVWRLQVTKEGFAPYGALVVREQDLAGIVLRPASSRGGVVRDRGNGVPGAIVRFSSGTSAEWVIVTDAQGRYSAPDPSIWSRAVTVHTPDHFVWRPSNRGEVKTDLDLTRGAALHGTVLKADGETPSANVTVTLDGVPGGTTDDQGNFRIIDPPSDWRVLEFSSGEGWASRSREAGASGVKIRLGASASLSGHVREGRTPVAGAVVRLVPDSPMAMLPGSESVREVVADRHGQFRIDPAPAGRYQLVVLHPAFEAESVSVDVAPGSRETRDLVVEPRALLTGHVVDEDGRPVAAASLRPAMSGDSMRSMIQRARAGSQASWSAPDGRFVVRQSARGEARLEARRSGFPPGTTDLLDLSRPSSLRNLRIVVPTGIEVAGVVHDESGAPVAGAVIGNQESRGEGAGRTRVIMIGEPRSVSSDEQVTTDAQGLFSMRLAPGRWDVSAGGAGWSTSWVRAVDVREGMEPLELTVSPAVAIRGRVIRKGGEGVAGAEVIAPTGAGRTATVTAADGSFELGGLNPGSVMLVVEKEDEMIREMRMTSAPADDFVLEIPPGGIVEGRVTDAETKAPVQAFSISVSGDRSSGGMMIRAPGVARQFESDDGSFRLPNVTASPAELIVRAPGFVEKRVRGVEVAPGETKSGVEVALSRGTTVRGTVTDGSGRALAGVVVSEADGAPRGMPRFGGQSSDAEGKYEAGPFDGETVDLTFSLDGYKEERREAKLDGRAITLDVRMSRGATLSGVVVDEGGAPVSGAEVAAAPQGEMFRGGDATTTDGSGSFSIGGFGEGRVRVTATRPGYAQAIEEDVDPAGPPLRLVLQRGGTVAGSVSGLTASELAEASVVISSGGSSRSVSIDTSGEFRATGIPEGAGQVRAVTGRMGRQRTSPLTAVDVTTGSEAWVEIEFSGEASVYGEVRMNGEAVPDAIVAFSPADPVVQTRASSTTDSSGRYTIDALETGLYRVSVLRLSGAAPVSWQGEHRLEGADRFDIEIDTLTIRGRVIDGANGRPVEGASVDVRKASSQTVIIGGGGIITAADGTFTFPNATEGGWLVRASAEGYGTGSESVDVSGADAFVEVRLDPSDGLSLRIVDARTGTSVSGLVSVQDAGGRTLLTDFTRPDAQGLSRLAVPAGSYRLRVNSEGYAPQWVSITVPGPAVTVAVTPGGTLDVMNRGSDVLRLRVIAEATGDPVSSGPGNVSGAAPGLTRFRNVPAGTLRIEVLDAAGAVIRNERVTVAEGAVSVLNL